MGLEPAARLEVGVLVGLVGSVRCGSENVDEGAGQGE